MIEWDQGIKSKEKVRVYIEGNTCVVNLEDAAFPRKGIGVPLAIAAELGLLKIRDAGYRVTSLGPALTGRYRGQHEDSDPAQDMTNLDAGVQTVGFICLVEKDLPKNNQ